MNLNEYLYNQTKGQIRSHSTLIFKNKTYIKNPSEAPEGAVIKIGPKGGQYYDDLVRKKNDNVWQWTDTNTGKTYDTHPKHGDPADTTHSSMINKAKKHIADFEVHTNNRINELKKEFPDRKVYGRTKDVNSALGKLRIKPETYKKISDIKDISGMRVESNSIKNVFKDVKKIKQMYPNIIDEKDYITNPKGNYSSYHLIVEKDGKPFEIQVRTGNMTKLADYMRDSIYKVSEEKFNVIKTNEKEINKYIQNMLKYYNSLDNGNVYAIHPDCVPLIAKIIDCL